MAKALVLIPEVRMNPQTGNGITSQTGNGVTSQTGNGITSQTGNVFSRRVNISILHRTPVPFIINILHLVRKFYFGSFYHQHFTSGEKILLSFRLSSTFYIW
jgi:hypothetical protein